MQFAASWWLVVVAALLVLGVAALASRARWRRAALERFGDRTLLERVSGKTLPSRARRITVDVLSLAALVLAGLALARPQWGETRATVRRPARDVLFVLDLSRSMNARDASPATSRLAAAKAAALAIADSLPLDRVGLVVFGGNAFLQLPLTADHSAFSQFVEQASTEDVPDPATDLASAADVAAATIARDGGPGAHGVVFLSDGEDSDGSLSDAVKLLDSARVRVFAVGVGSDAGAPVPNSPTDPRPHVDWQGRQVVSRLDEGSLRALAASGHGVYVRWSGEASVRPVVRAIAGLRAAVTTSTERAALVDRFEWFVALAVLALLAAALIDRPASPRSARVGTVIGRAAAGILVAAGLVAAMGAQARLDGGRVRRAAALYEQGRYREAYDAFRALARDAGTSGDAELRAELAYDIGNTQYRLAHFDEALVSYRGVLGASPGLRARAYFNLGNVYMHLADAAPSKRPTLRAAVNAYTEALVIDPHDADAKWNLELALRRLADEETRFGGGPQHRADWGGGNLTKSGYAGSPRNGAGATQGGGFGNPEGGESAPRISESQARQMLDAIQRSLVTGQLGATPRGAQATSRRRDW